MRIQKPTVDSCIDGKDHHWLVVNEDTDIVKRTRWERRWCQKCGVLTQVIINEKQVAIALLTEDKEPHLIEPELVKLLSKG